MIAQDFLVPYIISNLFALALIFICYKWPKAGKTAWGALFMIAGAFNIYTALSNPQIYVEAFGPSAVLSFYRNFIDGLFSRYTAVFVMLIGLGQMLSGFLLLMPTRWFRFGVTGGIIFLIAIAPLGTGSAFPSTLLMALSLVLLWRKRKPKE